MKPTPGLDGPSLSSLGRGTLRLASRAAAPHRQRHRRHNLASRGRAWPWLQQNLLPRKRRPPAEVHPSGGAASEGAGSMKRRRIPDQACCGDRWRRRLGL
ncbi:hypothetical protein BDA96_10G134300 [Sorghum bicolor]|uniref:Uncharacterized protein n=2 Tax=Sorghum bicolor TaxID=4558 RepID=A0A921Q400_SORBI|nr:hypothetical protein BDA96_10G134300 [Sorghum bicolor]KXG19742.1 hypothetical protein SORBI_3010G109800 [Sorghum bicolor]